MKTALRVILTLLMLTSLNISPSSAAVMNDYCIVPPFIQEVAKPNLLMILDNSASMYDLAYDDKGLKHCSGSATTVCSTDADCGTSGGTCTVFDRNPRYCFDDTYKATNTYVGYFSRYQADGTTAMYYSYDFTNNIFVPQASTYTFSCTSTDINFLVKSVANQLCIILDPSKTVGSQVATFVASGNYLNWLSASKFDVEKQVLTGGKYVTKLCANDATRPCTSSNDCSPTTTACSSVANPFLMPESRGCVGQGYIKTALTTDFVNFATSGNDTNTQLGITFTVRGPNNPYNSRAASNGGQTYLDIFYGNTPYDYGSCQAALTAINSGTVGDIKQLVDACLGATNKTGICAKFPNPNCSTDADCVVSSGATTAENVCTGAPSMTCTTDANCTLNGKFCSGKQSLACTNDTKCTPTIAEVKGVCTSVLLSYCKKGTSGSTCVPPASVGELGAITTRACTSDANCSYGDWVISGSGACEGYKPSYVANYGTCNTYTNVSFGPCISNNLGPCNGGTTTGVVKTKVVFNQSLQECWKIRPAASRTGPEYGFTNMNTVKQQCTDIYTQFASCSNNQLTSCTVATQTADCGSGNTCITGPAAIGPGNPGILCGNTYVGQCFNWDPGAKKITLKANCQDWGTSPTDSLAYQEWQYCKDFDVSTPQVIDPTNPPADNTTSTSTNLPGILSGTSVFAQLGQAKASIPVKIQTAAAPSGIIQEFQNKIRMGVMSFNQFGSVSESSNATIGVRKVCSNDTRIVCGSNTDCGTGTCSAPTGANADLDGAKVLYPIAKGTCSVTTTTSCSTAKQCPTGEKCISAGAGDHTTGMIRVIDDIRASSWTPFAEAFYNAIGYFAKDQADTSGKSSRTDLRLNTSDFDAGMNPSESVCQANNILLVTDGSSTADQNSSMTDLVNTYKSVTGNVTGTCSYYFGSQNLDDIAWLAKHRNINTFSKTALSPTLPSKKNESISTYVVFNGGDNGEAGDCNNTTMLTKTANNGGTGLLKTEIPSQYESALRSAFNAVAGGTASGTAASILSNSEGSGANILQAVFYPYKEFETVSGQTTPTSAAWIGEMQNLWYYVDPYVGNSSVREDTNLDSALHISNDYVVEFQFKGGETIAALKQDTNKDGAGETVVTNSMDSRVTSQGYCTNTPTPSLSSYSKCATDAGCQTGESCVIQGIVNADNIYSLWRAGKLLWNRTLSSSPRKLYTYLYGTTVTTPVVPATCGVAPLTFSSNGMIDLVLLKYQDGAGAWQALPAGDKCVIMTLLQAGTVDEAGDILKYIQGYDHSAYDSSTGKITGLIGGNTPRSRSVQIGGTKKVWKLGDVISSTPRIQSFNKLNNFHLDVPVGYADTSYANENTGGGYANSSAYKARGMAYAGANDGMLHAFKLGTLSITGFGDTKATLTGTGLGEEQWSFIPKNVLPYLKYLADPNYSHLYLVDGPTKLVDASIGYGSSSYIDSASTLSATAKAAYKAGCVSVTDASGETEFQYWPCWRDTATDNNNSWRTILIGSMGIGGASHESTSTCTTCVKSPIVGVGKSSYFALDVTDPTSPKYMWEFSSEDMGFATSGVAVVRINHKVTSGGVDYKDTNGRWFAVFGSGPTGPIDTTYHQFKGRSTNPLSVFVVDLKKGPKTAVNPPEALKKFTTTINSAFAGSMASAPIDTDRTRVLDSGFYSDDALYFGYSNCTSLCGSGNDVWNGGIMRLLTGESVDPENWSLTTLISNTGPITTSVGKLQDRKNHNLWLYTGSGRYFFKGDDSVTPGKILAVKEPCYDKTNDDIYSTSAITAQTTKCTTEMAFTTDTDVFADQTSAINSMTTVAGVSKKGWFITLGAEDTVNNYGAERIITEPVPMPNGAVFFTSFMPSTDACNYGGNSYMWGMTYDTGGTASSNQLKGKALVQVSTGSFEEVNLSTQLTSNLGRKMANPMVGKPPTDPPPIVSASGNKPLKRILHIQEK